MKNIKTTGNNSDRWRYITKLKLWDCTNIWYEFGDGYLVRHDDRIFKNLKY